MTVPIARKLRENQDNSILYPFKVCLNGVNKRNVAKLIRLKTSGISYRLKATAAPIAPVFQMLAAVAVPWTS